MKKIFVTLVLAGLFLMANAQEAWNDFGPNFAGVAFKPKVLVYNDSVLVAYINPVTENVDVKISGGSGWIPVASFSTVDRQFDFEKDVDGRPVLAVLSLTLDFDLNKNFDLKLHKYNAGVMSEISTAYITFGPNTNNTVDIFDFAVNPNGGYGIIFRYNNSYQAVYLAKVGADEWSGGYLVNAPGNSSGVKESILTYNSSGAIIMSRNQSTFGGPVNAPVFHRFFHNTTVSDPTSISSPSLYALPAESGFSMAVSGDTVFVSVIYGSAASIFYCISNSQDPFSYNLLANLPSEIISPVLKINGPTERYIAYVEDEGASFPGKIARFNPDFSSSTLVGSEAYNNAGNAVGEFDFAIAGNELFVAYGYGPPFNNSKVRRFGCKDAPLYTFNAQSNHIETLEDFSGTPFFQWFNCNTNTPVQDAFAPTFVPLVTGSYQVQIINESCVTFSNCVEYTEPGGMDITEFELDGILIFPNPSNGVFSIQNIPIGSKIELVSSLGQIVYSEKANASLYTFSDLGLGAGMYKIRIVSPSGMAQVHSLVISE